MNEYQIPADWAWKPLSQLADIVSGGTPSRVNPAFWGGSIPWVTPSDITSRSGTYLTFTSEFITETGLRGSSAKLLPKGSVLMTSRATLGQAKLAISEVCTNQGFKNLVPHEDVDGLFLLYQMQLHKDRYANYGTGTTFLEVNKKDTACFEIPVPPTLSEQRRIATILAALDEQIERTGAWIAKQQLMLDGLIDELLITPNRKAKLSDYAEIGPRTNVSKAPDQVPFLPMDAVSEEGQISRVETKPWSSVSTGFTRFASGDVLVAKITPCFENGKGAHVPNSAVVWAGSTEFHVIRAKPGVSQRWVYWHTRAREFREKGAMQMTGSAGQQRVPRSFLERFPVRKINENEQASIASILDSVQEALVSERKLLSKLRLNKQGLMADLLTGRVRVNKEDIPNDR